MIEKVRSVAMILPWKTLEGGLRGLYRRPPPWASDRVTRPKGPDYSNFTLMNRL
jgi:hypothetical protein